MGPDKQAAVEVAQNKQGPRKQAQSMTAQLAVRRAFVPRLVSASLRQKASWIAPWPSPSPLKR